MITPHIFYLALAFVLSAVVTVVSLHITVALLVAILGEQKSISTAAVNGCNSWPFATLISLGVCAFVWNDFGYQGLFFTPVGTLIAASFVAFRLRFRDAGARVEEFIVEGRATMSASRRRPIRADYVAEDGGYYSTGPASGYCVYKLELWGTDGLLARNSYVHEGRKDKDLKALVHRAGVKMMSLTFIGGYDDKNYATHTMSREMAHLILTRGRELAPQERSWWEQFIQPRFTDSDVIGVEPEVLNRRLRAYAGTWPKEISQSEDLQGELTSLKTLARESTVPVKLMSETCLFAYIEEHRDAVFHLGGRLRADEPA